MAFRTNKEPVLQTKSASGSVATFNTALAMPLSSCNIAVNAWQEGSGDPSPSNVRAIHGFSEVNVNANAVVHTIQLGQEVYGGVLDLDSGVLNITHKYILLNSLGWSYSTSSTLFASESLDDIKAATSQSDLTTITSSSYKTTSVGGRTNYSIMCSTNKRIWIVDNDYTDANDFISARGNTQISYPLATPITIQLTPTQIETIAGKTNTIFADTGDVDLTYKDLDIAKRGNFREVFRLPS